LIGNAIFSVAAVILIVVAALRLSRRVDDVEGAILGSPSERRRDPIPAG